MLLRGKDTKEQRHKGIRAGSSHVARDAESEVLKLPEWCRMVSASRWREELSDGLDEQQVDRLRMNTHAGRPLGSDSFLSKLEKLIDRMSLVANRLLIKR